MSGVRRLPRREPCFFCGGRIRASRLRKLPGAVEPVEPYHVCWKCAAKHFPAAVGADANAVVVVDNQCWAFRLAAAGKE